MGLAVIAALCALATPETGRAQQQPRKCDPAAVELDLGQQPLTREERLAIMDRAFQESLARFEECQDGGGSDSAASGGGTEGGGGGAGASANAAGSGAGEAGTDRSRTDETGRPQATASRAATGVSGRGRPDADGPTPSEADPAAAAGVRGTTPVASRPPPADGSPETAPTPSSPSAPVRTLAQDPPDVPPPDNDNAFERQLRHEAQKETDPQVKAKLWNEYRRYKGLPEKPVPEAREPAGAETPARAEAEETPGGQQ